MRHESRSHRSRLRPPALPAYARGPGDDASSRATPARGPRARVPRPRAARFDLVGAALAGARARRVPHARRSPGAGAAGGGCARGEDLPDRGSAEQRAARLAARQPVLDGRVRPRRSTALQGRVTRLRALLRLEPATRTAPRERSARRLAADHHARSAGAPTSRSGARAPRYAPALQLAVVHHTAGSNALHAGAVGRDRARRSRSTT